MNNKCPHSLTTHEVVTFKNGTKHVQIRCTGCERRLGYVSKSEVDMKNLPTGETNRQYRLSLSLPVGCRNCGSDECKISGVCKGCEEKRFHKPLKKYSRALGKTIFQLNKEELLSYHEMNKNNVE